MRLTKEELISSAKVCFNVFLNYYGLKSRYDDLKDAVSLSKMEKKLAQGQISLLELISA